MTDLFNRIDSMLIKRYPNLWILGVHIFLPIVLMAYVALMLLGYINAGSMQEMVDTENSKFFLNIMLVVTLPVIFLFIWFFIRQIRYNSTRIHHSLPFKLGIINFLAFVLIMLSIAAIPVMPLMGNYFKAKVLTSEVRAVQGYSEAGNSVLDLNYYTSSPTDLEGADIYSSSEKNLARKVHYGKDQFMVANWNFWMNYALGALLFSMILFAVCATNGREFGWAMLYCGLFPIIYGILNFLLNIGNGFNSDIKFISLGLLTVMIIGIALAAFVKGLVKDGTSRSFAIMLYLFSPYFVFTYTSLLDFDNVSLYLPVLFGTGLLATLLFNEIFKKKYVDPI